MNKEELIKLIETLEFEEVRCMTLSYYKKKPKKSYAYYEEAEDINPKTITFGTDLEKIISENFNSNRNLINELYREVERLKDSDIK